MEAVLSMRSYNSGEWENDIVTAFRNKPDRGGISGFYEMPFGQSLHLARQFQIWGKARQCDTHHG